MQKIDLINGLSFLGSHFLLEAFLKIWFSSIMGGVWKCRFLGPTPDPLNQILWGCKPSSLGDS